MSQPLYYNRSQSLASDGSTPERQETDRKDAPQTLLNGASRDVAIGDFDPPTEIFDHPDPATHTFKVSGRFFVQAVLTFDQLVDVELMAWFEFNGDAAHPIAQTGQLFLQTALLNRTWTIAAVIAAAAGDTLKVRIKNNKVGGLEFFGLAAVQNQTRLYAVQVA